MKPVYKSTKLDNVCYDIRGPVLDEAKGMEAAGQEILKLNIGNPAPFGFQAPEEIVRHISENLTKAEGYIDSKGRLSAREAIAAYSNHRGIPGVDVENIFIGNGVSELIVMALQGFLNDGDEILIPAPDYPLWTAAVVLAGGTPVHYICDELSDWQPDISDIKRKISPRTKGVVVINPNNPTGTRIDEGELRRLLDGVPPQTVVLLDELEKAHQDVFNVLLQVMDHGKLTDHNGKQVDFRNVILIMTTNAGAADMAKTGIGFGREVRVGEDEEAIKRMFTPEFRNRLDAIIQFASLDAPTIERVVDKLILEVEMQLEQKGVTISLDDAARRWIGEKGYDRATVHEIARRAGVVRATIYVHFATREALLEAVTDRALAEVVTVITAAEPERGAPDAALGPLAVLSVPAFPSPDQTGWPRRQTHHADQQPEPCR